MLEYKKTIVRLPSIHCVYTTHFDYILGLLFDANVKVTSSTDTAQGSMEIFYSYNSIIFIKWRLRLSDCN